ncbi:MAG: hypothetical protein ACRD2W_11335 [Acidimicrobiales bacterium]
MEKALAFAIGLLMVCNLAVVTIHYLDDHTSLVSGRNAATGGGSDDVRVIPGEGQAFVTGTATEITAEAAQAQPLKTPFSVTPVERGVGRASIEKALMGGRRVTITWDGGTPLPVSGEGELILGSTRVTLNEDGPVFSLDPVPRSFKPGTYSLGATVGVGTTGIGTPRDGVTFTADEQTIFVSRGAVVVKLSPQKVDLLGPGKLTMKGTLEVQFPDRTTDSSSVSFGGGPYRLTVEPGAAGLTVDAIFQGSVEAG